MRPGGRLTQQRWWSCVLDFTEYRQHTERGWGASDQHQSLSKEAGEQSAGSTKIKHRARAPEQKEQPFGLLGIHDCGEDESLMSVRRTFEDSIKKARRFQASFQARPCAYINYGGAE